MKVVLVAHECGIPQWLWCSESSRHAVDAFTAAAAAVARVGDDAAAHAFAAWLRAAVPLPTGQRAAALEALVAGVDGAWLLLAALVKRRPPAVATAGAAPGDGTEEECSAEVSSLSDDYAGGGSPIAYAANGGGPHGPATGRWFSHLAGRLTVEGCHCLAALAGACTLHNLFTAFAADASLAGALLALRGVVMKDTFDAGPVCTADAAPVAAALCHLVRTAADLAHLYSQEHIVKNALLRIVSTQSYLAHTKKLPCASYMSYGTLRCAIEREHWTTTTRTARSVFRDDENVFFSTASDEGDSPLALARLTRLTKQASKLALGALHRIKSQMGCRANGYSPQSVLGCVVKGVLRTGGAGHQCTLGAQVGALPCLHECLPYWRPAAGDGGPDRCAAVQSVLLDRIDTAIRAAASPSATPTHTMDTRSRYEFWNQKPPPPPVHCMVFVNEKLACVHTPNHTPTLSATDVYFLSLLVEGAFVYGDGTSYDPGQGTSWDPLSSVSRVSSTAGTSASAQSSGRDTAVAPTTAEMEKAEATLRPWDVHRGNFYTKEKEKVMRRAIAERLRAGVAPSPDALEDAWAVLVQWGRAQLPGESTVASAEALLARYGVNRANVDHPEQDNLLRGVVAAQGRAHAHMSSGRAQKLHAAWQTLRAHARYAHVAAPVVGSTSPTERRRGGAAPPGAADTAHVGASVDDGAAAPASARPPPLPLPLAQPVWLGGPRPLAVAESQDRGGRVLMPYVAYVDSLGDPSDTDAEAEPSRSDPRASLTGAAAAAGASRHPQHTAAPLRTTAPVAFDKRRGAPPGLGLTSDGGEDGTGTFGGETTFDVSTSADADSRQDWTRAASPPFFGDAAALAAAAMARGEMCSPLQGGVAGGGGGVREDTVASPLSEVSQPPPPTAAAPGTAVAGAAADTSFFTPPSAPVSRGGSQMSTHVRAASQSPDPGEGGGGPVRGGDASVTTPAPAAGRSGSVPPRMAYPGGRERPGTHGGVGGGECRSASLAGERAPSAGSAASSAREREAARARAADQELKFSSIRVCILMPMESAPGPLGGRPESLEHMRHIRNSLRSALAPVLDFLTTVEKTHFNLPGGPYAERCPGLIHFVLVDRYRHNRLIAPSLVPTRPVGMEDAEDGSGFFHFTAAEHAAHESAMAPRIAALLQSAHHMLSRGHTQSLWGADGYQYFFKACLEIDGDEVAMDDGLLGVLRNTPWGVRDHLDSGALGRLKGRHVRCYELYALYLGMMSPAAVERCNKALLDIALPR